MANHLSARQKMDLARLDAHGSLVAVLVGASMYGHSNFPKLKTCAYDAEHVAKRLRQVHQLNADQSRISLVTSSQGHVSIGRVLNAVKQAVEKTNDGDRLLFYFSGHGYRFPNDERLFLVPDDVWDVVPEAMIDFEKVCELMSNSPAREKYLVLDACYSGPVTGKIKGPLSEQSVKFVTDYIARTKGFTIIGSSSEDEPSHTQSPDPQLSLFTHYFCRALQGEKGALNGTQLTSTSLVEYLTVEVTKRAKSYQSRQTPSFKIAGTGVQIWADFAAILAPAVLDLAGCPVKAVEFQSSSGMAVKDVLTSIRYFSAHQEFYLEKRVNDYLGDHLRDDLGEKSAALIEEFGWSASDAYVEDASISFPRGHYAAEYKAEGKKSGHLIETVTFQEDWFSRPQEILRVVEVLRLYPTTVRFNLKFDIDPASAIPGLKAQGWRLVSSLDEKVEMEEAPQRVILTPQSLAFRGFVLNDLFGSENDKRSARLAAGVFNALPNAVS